MISSPILKALIAIGILLVLGISIWLIKKYKNKEDQSILNDEQKSIMVINKKPFRELKNDKSIVCKSCHMRLVNDACTCEFSVIKCPVDKSHLFHYECFIKEMGKPSKCPVCLHECLKEFYMFTGDLCRSLLENENIAKKFSILRQQVRMFEPTLAVFLLDDGRLKMDEVNRIAENLEKNSSSSEMGEFAKVLRKCGHMNEIFEKSKRELFNDVISGRYSEEAFYPIYFNSSHEMIQELTNEEIVQLLSVYCLRDNYISLSHRLAYLTIFLTRMYLRERQFRPEDMKEVLLSAIRNKNILALRVISNYVSWQPYLNFEKFHNLLDEAIKNMSEKDLGLAIGILKNYYKNISANILETFRLFLENKSEYVKDAIYNLFEDNPIQISFLEMKEILNLYISTKTSIADVIPVLAPSISKTLTLKQFEELINEIKSLGDTESYALVLCLWFIKNPPDITRIQRLLREIEEKEITDMVYHLGYNGVIDVPKFMELINISERKTAIRIIEGGEFVYGEMNESEIEQMECKCRDFEIVDHFVFFIHRMTKEQTVNLSESDVKSIIDGLENIKIDTKYISMFSNIFDSHLLYLQFPNLIMKVIDMVKPSGYMNIFERVFENPHFEEYVDHRMLADFIYTVIEHRERKEILKAVFGKCNTRLNQILMKFHLVGKLITTKQQPRGSSNLDEVLRTYDIDSYMKAFKGDKTKFVEIMDKLDDGEVIERIGEVPIKQQKE